MRNRPFILRCAAFFLILVFSQKAGAGLFLHNFFHSSIAKNESAKQQHKQEKGFSYACTCVDDFLLPYTAADEPVYSLNVLAFATPLTFFEEPIPFYSSVLYFLRGPPAATA